MLKNLESFLLMLVLLVFRAVLSLEDTDLKEKDLSTLLEALGEAAGARKPPFLIGSCGN